MLPIVSPPAELVAHVMRNRQRPLVPGELEQLAYGIGKEQIRLILREYQTVVSKSTGVPFVTEECNKAVTVSFLNQFSRFRPVQRMSFEALHPMHMPLSRHDRHIVPGGVSGEGKEIQMLLGNLDGTFEGTLGISHGVVIVKIPPEELVLLV